MRAPGWRSAALRLAGVASLLVAAAAAPSHAATRVTLARDVTITGSRTGWVAVTLPRAIFADCPGASACAPKARLRLGGGAYGYELVYDAADTRAYVPTTGVVRLPRAEGGHVLALTNGQDPRTGADTADTGVLPAGRYRLFLLTNGPGSVSVRFPELPAGSTSLRVATAVTTRTVETAPPAIGPLAPSSWAAGVTAPAITGGSHGYAFLWTDGPAAAVSLGSLCVYTGQPPQGAWVPGCPGGQSVMANQFTPALDCCGTMYGVVRGRGAAFSFGDYYVQGGPVTKAGAFFLWLPDR